MWQAVSMKNKNMRDMEKHWAEQKKKAAKPAKSPVQPKHEDATQAAQATKKTAKGTTEKA
jgi:hypothetical protein